MAILSVVVQTSLRFDLHDPRWVEHISSRPEAQPFHHPAWAEFVAGVYGFRAFALAVIDSDGNVAGGLPVAETRGRQWVSLPFTDVCAPLSAGCDGSEFTAVLEQARRAASMRELVIHGKLPGRAFNSTVAVLHTLDLTPGPEALHGAFHRSQVRRAIAAAEKSSLELRRAAHAEEITRDYYGLHLMTRKRQGVPVQPRRFFERLWTDVLEFGLGHALLAYADEVAVAGAVFLSWNGTTIYKYGASDRRYGRLRANHLIFWAAIRQSCAQGDQIFDFGKSAVDNTGLRAFKSSWGSVEMPLVYSTLADRPSRSSTGRLQRIAAPVIRRSPSFVCKAAGELLYKYAA